MALKKNKKPSTDTFCLGVNFKVKDLNMVPLAGCDATEEVITICGYANFAGSCVDEASTFMDRVGDIVVPDGIDLTNYKKSPIILFQHDRETVIGKAVELTKRVDGLYVTAEVHAGACEEETFYAIKNGLYTSFSIGFRTRKAEYKTVGDKEIFFITNSELLEISVVSIPACTDSTFNVVKSFEGNIYAGDLDHSPQNIPAKNAEYKHEGDRTLKILFRDSLTSDQVKEFETLGLAGKLDEPVEVDTKLYVDAKYATLKAVIDGLTETVATLTKSAEAEAETTTEEALPTAEEVAAAAAEAIAAEEVAAAAVEAAVEEEKAANVEAVKALSESFATLKALVEEK